MPGFMRGFFISRLACKSIVTLFIVSLLVVFFILRLSGDPSSGHNA